MKKAGLIVWLIVSPAAERSVQAAETIHYGFPPSFIYSNVIYHWYILISAAQKSNDLNCLWSVMMLLTVPII